MAASEASISITAEAVHQLNISNNNNNSRAATNHKMNNNFNDKPALTLPIRAADHRGCGCIGRRQLGTHVCLHTPRHERRRSVPTVRRASRGSGCGCRD
eukprot:365534-Chlamydomonas_euryale.AAC.23